MGFFSGLFGAHSQDVYSTTVTRNAIISTSDLSDGSTGVSRYLDEKPSTALSGVAKYLKEQEHNQPSGVAKYLARQAITEKNKPVVVLSGVAKYVLQKAIAERNTPEKPKKTRVESYLQSLPETKISSVSKYLAKQTAATAEMQIKNEAAAITETIVNDVALTGVEKYLQAQR